MSLGKVIGTGGTGGTSGALKKSLLWRNPNSKVGFSACTLSFDYSKYDYLMIEAQVLTTYTDVETNIIPIIKGSYFSITSVKQDSSVVLTQRRGLMNDACDSIELSDGYTNSNTNTTVARCIPTAIYGIIGKIN